jgi:hypothetical protein
VRFALEKMLLKKKQGPSLGAWLAFDFLESHSTSKSQIKRTLMLYKFTEANQECIAEHKLTVA